jgi:hypothetical protein
VAREWNSWSAYSSGDIFITANTQTYQLASTDVHINPHVLHWKTLHINTETTLHTASVRCVYYALLCIIPDERINYFPVFTTIDDRLCGLMVRVPGYTTEMYCDSCEVGTEFIYVR